MKHYLFYAQSGEIVATATLQDEIDPATVDPRPYLIVLQPLSGNDYWVSAGSLIEYDAATKRRKLSWPGRGFVWNPARGDWDDSRDTSEAWDDVRSKRDKLLAETDWIVTKAVERGEPVPLDWAIYRQALRDITVQPDPYNIIWPTPPS